MDNIAHKYYDVFTNDSTNLITFARGIFQPFKEIYGFKRTEGILWWRKVIWEDLKIRYSVYGLDKVKVTVTFENYISDYGECSVEYDATFTRSQLQCIVDGNDAGKEFMYKFLIIAAPYKRVSGF